ncbi:5808_t:CDS:2, partial [Gigaspora rosea]
DKDPEYDEVKNLFAIKTKIHAIIKLQMLTKLENKHEKYKKSIAKGPDKSWNNNLNNDIIKMENNIPKFCK